MTTTDYYMVKHIKESLGTALSYNFRAIYEDTDTEDDSTRSILNMITSFKSKQDYIEYIDKWYSTEQGVDTKGWSHRPKNLDYSHIEFYELVEVALRAAIEPFGNNTPTYHHDL